MKPTSQEELAAPLIAEAAALLTAIGLSVESFSVDRGDFFYARRVTVVGPGNQKLILTLMTPRKDSHGH